MDTTAPILHIDMFLSDVFFGENKIMMVYATVYIPSEVDAALKLRARGLGVSKGSIMREIICSNVEISPLLPNFNFSEGMAGASEAVASEAPPLSVKKGKRRVPLV